MTAAAHIITLTADNFKRIRAVRITPDGSLVQSSGRNAQGKSSVLDAIQAALGGGAGIPEQPLRRGARRGEIVVELPDLTVRRTFSPTGSTLTVEAKDGSKLASPQAVLDKLVGRLTFDPLNFMRMPDKAQAETLLKLAGLDFARTDAARAAAYTERTVVNRNVTAYKGAMPAAVFAPDAPIPEAPDVTAIVARRDEAAAVRQANAQTRQRLGAATAKVAEYLENIRQLEAELKAQRDALGKATEYEAAIAASVAAIVDPEIPNVTAEINAAEGLKTKLRTHADRERRLAELRKLEYQERALTLKISRADEEKALALQEAKLPVDGLSVSETGVTFKGVPLAQASGAEQLRVSVAMAVALNPTLKVVLVRDGNVLDSAGLKLLADLAEKHGLQVWLERVSDGEPIGVVIEDGMVAAEPFGPAPGAVATGVGP